MKELPVHLDRIGRTLSVGDCVAYPSSNVLLIGIITKLNQKMINVKRLGSLTYVDRKYGSDTIKVDGPEITMYLLKFGGKR